VTLGFAYLLIFLGGFTLALVTGFARRLLHPTELCDHVVVPSHEHLRGLRYPAADVLASFLTVFGLSCLIIHGTTALAPVHEIAIGLVTGVIGIFFLRFWLRRVCDPTERVQATPSQVRVVRDIPAQGYGQIEMVVDGGALKLAARSQDLEPIPAGALVDILERSESVVVVTSRTK
jgi:membrane protein implicated in regulation of membrane protease activity